MPCFAALIFDIVALVVVVVRNDGGCLLAYDSFHTRRGGGGRRNVRPLKSPSPPGGSPDRMTNLRPAVRVLTWTRD